MIEAAGSATPTDAIGAHFADLVRRAREAPAVAGSATPDQEDDDD